MERHEAADGSREVAGGVSAGGQDSEHRDDDGEPHPPGAPRRILARSLIELRQDQPAEDERDPEPADEGGSVPHDRPSVPEVIELQRQVELRAAQQPDGLLQVVALLPADAHLLALDAGLDLKLGVLDETRDLPTGLGVDPLFEENLLAGGGEGNLGLLDVQARQVDAPLAETQLQDIQHLLQLKIDLRVQGHRGILELEPGPGIFEVEALSELAIRLIDGVRHLVGIQLGNDVERGHGSRSFEAPGRRPIVAECPAVIRSGPCHSSTSVPSGGGALRNRSGPLDVDATASLSTPY